MKTNMKMNMAMAIVCCAVGLIAPAKADRIIDDILAGTAKAIAEANAIMDQGKKAMEQKDKQRRESVAYPNTPYGPVRKIVDGHRVLCSNCKGEGWFSTRCVYCSRKGQVVCSTCNGQRTFAAPGCLPMVCGCNNGMSICWRCTGSGLGNDMIKCKQCDGNGSYLVND